MKSACASPSICSRVERGSFVAIIRIAGLLRSGSNLMTWMLRNNFESAHTVTMLLGWKHGPIHRHKSVLSIEDYVDPRFIDGIVNFVRDHPAQWAAATATPLFREAAEAQRNQTFAVALAVRDPALWYASCRRIHSQSPDFLPHGISPREAATYWNRRHGEWLGQLESPSVIVDTEALKADPEPVLGRMAEALHLVRIPGVRTPGGYLHPQGQEEIYELLGMPVPTFDRREFTRLTDDEGELRREFLGLLDTDILTRLGLGEQGD
jgi:hypothetical protein